MSSRIRHFGPPELVLAAGLAAAAGVIFAWGSELTFAFDEWDFLLGRLGTGADAFLQPHFEHISIAPAVIYKSLLSVFGMDSPRPFQLVSTALLIATLALLFVYLRRRLGPWLALAGIVPLLFFGPAWDNVLWPFQMAFMGSMASGLGALLALDRGDRPGDLVGCALLTVGMTFSSLWLPFAIGAAVHVLTGERRRQRIFVFAVPVLLYGLWWLGWGREAESVVSFNNLATIPQYVLDGLSSSISSLLGLEAFKEDTESIALDWARPLLIVLGALVALRLRRLGTVPRGVWVTTAILLSFWILSAANANFFRHPTAHRYQLIGAVLLLLVAADVWRGTRPRPAAVGVALAVAVAAAVGNFVLLHREWETFRDFGQVERGELAAVELARDGIDPQLVLSSGVAGAAIYGNAGLYLEAADAYGSPAYTADELAASSEGARAAADRTFAVAHGLGFEPAAQPAPGRCLRSPGNGAAPRVLDLPPGGIVLELGRGGGRARLRRYASGEFPVELGAVPAGASRLAIPADRSDEPWELELVADGPVSVCRL